MNAGRVKPAMQVYGNLRARTGHGENLQDVGNRGGDSTLSSVLRIHLSEMLCAQHLSDKSCDQDFKVLQVCLTWPDVGWAERGKYQK